MDWRWSVIRAMPRCLCHSYHAHRHWRCSSVACGQSCTRRTLPSTCAGRSHTGVSSEIFPVSHLACRASQGYGLTMQQGGAALKQLGLDMKPVCVCMYVCMHVCSDRCCRLPRPICMCRQDSISSTAHFSFTPNGRVIGCYGRRLRAQQANAPVVQSLPHTRTPPPRPRPHLALAFKTTWTPETPGYHLAIDSLLSGTAKPTAGGCTKKPKPKKKKKKKKKGNRNRHIPRQVSPCLTRYPNPPRTHRPQRLRQLLFNALLPGTVRWGHQLEGYTEHADGVTLALARSVCCWQAGRA